jgi:hypothetical protein
MGERDLPPIEHGIRLWCEICDRHQPFVVCPATRSIGGRGDQGGPYSGDLLCAVCLLVLTSYTSDHEGPHELRPVARA